MCAWSIYKRNNLGHPWLANKQKQQLKQNYNNKKKHPENHEKHNNHPQTSAGVCWVKSLEFNYVYIKTRYHASLKSVIVRCMSVLHHTWTISQQEKKNASSCIGTYQVQVQVKFWCKPTPDSSTNIGPCFHCKNKMLTCRQSAAIDKTFIQITLEVPGTNIWQS